MSSRLVSAHHADADNGISCKRLLGLEARPTLVDGCSCYQSPSSCNRPPFPPSRPRVREDNRTRDMSSHQRDHPTLISKVNSLNPSLLVNARVITRHGISLGFSTSLVMFFLPPEYCKLYLYTPFQNQNHNSNKGAFDVDLGSHCQSWISTPAEFSREGS